MYDEDLINIAFEAANEIGLQNSVNEGTLAMLGGPTFETPAELRMLKVCGVDAVGKNIMIASMKIHSFNDNFIKFNIESTCLSIFRRYERCS